MIGEVHVVFQRGEGGGIGGHAHLVGGTCSLPTRSISMSEKLTFKRFEKYVVIRLI